MRKKARESCPGAHRDSSELITLSAGSITSSVRFGQATDYTDRTPVPHQLAHLPSPATYPVHPTIDIDATDSWAVRRDKLHAQSLQRQRGTETHQHARTKYERLPRGAADVPPYHGLDDNEHTHEEHRYAVDGQEVDGWTGHDWAVSAASRIMQDNLLLPSSSQAANEELPEEDVYDPVVDDHGEMHDVEYDPAVDDYDELPEETYDPLQVGDREE